MASAWGSSWTRAGHDAWGGAWGPVPGAAGQPVKVLPVRGRAETAPGVRGQLRTDVIPGRDETRPVIVGSVRP